MVTDISLIRAVTEASTRRCAPTDCRPSCRPASARRQSRRALSREIQYGKRVPEHLRSHREGRGRRQEALLHPGWGGVPAPNGEGLQPRVGPAAHRGTEAGGDGSEKLTGGAVGGGGGSSLFGSRPRTFFRRRLPP